MSSDEKKYDNEPALLAYFAGTQNELPVPLADTGTNPVLSAEEFEKKCIEKSFAWLKDYNAIPSDDGPGRARFLRKGLHNYGLALGNEFSRNLFGGVSLALMLRDSVYENIVDANRQRVFASGKHFTSCFLHAYGISGAEDQVSRLRRSADLWLMIVDGGLPHPPVLSRLDRLLTLDSLEVALFEYSELVKEASGRVPTLAAINQAVDRWKKPELPRPDRRAWARGLWTDLTKARDLLAQEAPPVKEIAQLLAKMDEILKQRVGEEGNKAKKKPPKVNLPGKLCPLRLVCSGKSLKLHLEQTDAEVVALLATMAPSLGWTDITNARWQLRLPEGDSAAHAKKFHMVEWLTRVLERLDYQAPANPTAS
jgi:hypothetical protein